MATRIIWNRIADPVFGVGAVKGRPVSIRCYVNGSKEGGAFTADKEIVGGVGTTVKVDDTGYWEAELEVNDDLIPTGTYYSVKEPGGGPNWDIVVQAGDPAVKVRLLDAVEPTPTNSVPIQAGVAQADFDALATTVGGKLAKSANLSDLASAATARSNLGLHDAATHYAADFSPAVAGPFENRTFDGRGDSWEASTVHVSTSGRLVDRLVRRAGMTLVDHGVSSRTVPDAAYTALGGSWAYAPGTKSLIFMSSTHLNDSKLYGTTTPAQLAFKYALDSFLSVCTAWASVSSLSDQFVFDSTFAQEAVSTTTASSQTAGATVFSTGGGNRWRTTTVGGYGLVSTQSDKVDLILIARTAGAGLCTVTDNNTGTVLGTLDLTAAVAQETPAVLHLTGLGTSARTLKFTLTSGASLTVDSIRIPSTIPPPVLFAPAPDVPAGGSGNTLPGGDPAATYQAAQALYRTWLGQVVTAYPTAVVADLNAAGFTAADFDSDKRHLNDRGSAKAAGVVLATMATIDYNQGLNVLDSAGDPPAYVSPTAPTTPPGGHSGSGVIAPAADTPVSGASHDFSPNLLPIGSLTSWTPTEADGAHVLTGTSTVMQEGGRRFVRVNGTNGSTGDTMVNSTLPRTAPETIALVFRAWQAPATQRFILSAYTASPTNTIGFDSGTTNYVASEGTAGSPSPAIVPDLNWHVLIVVFNGASSTISVDGVETAVNLGTASSKVGVRLGAAVGDSSRGKYDYRRVVVIPSALNGTQRAALYTQLAALS